jgi:hypothetical protein
MPRTFSVARRRTNLVDITVPRRDNIIGFRFSASSNFDAAFTNFQVVPNDGVRTLRAPAAGGPRTPDISMPGNQRNRRNNARFVFDPDEYTAGVPVVRDDTPFFVRLESQNPNGTFNAAEAMQLVQPYSSAPHRPVQLFGIVPAGAALANSLEIQLPYQCQDFEITNNGAAILYVAFERPGYEYQLQPQTTIFDKFEQIVTSVSQIFVRGAGGPTTMSAIFTLRNESMGL